MAAKKRNNGPARWAVLLAGALAAAGFWTGVVTAPQPGQTGVAQAAAAPPAPAASQVQSQNGRQRFISPSIAQSPAFSPPRLRTRGS